MFPIDNFREEIVASVLDEQVTIIVGAPGSGKTTRLPQILYREIDFEGTKMVITEPRRLATTATATFVAQEMQVELGELVGYHIRQDRQVSKETGITFMTEGMLIQAFKGDPLLREYSFVIVDEVHERSVNTDQLLRMLKKVLEERPEFRLILASATVDTKVLESYYPGANLIEIPGRMFPVTIHHSLTDYPTPESMYPAIMSRIESIVTGHDIGDVLVFLPRTADIRELTNLLEQESWSLDLEILPAHGSLAVEDLMKVIRPSAKKCKVILATNIAETSITIDGVKYVIDTGLVNQAHYEHWSGSTRMRIAEHSQAGVTQRTGRAGRTATGTCYRLFTQENYDLRPQFPEPDILRSNLDSLVLNLLQYGITDPYDAGFITPPSRSPIADAIKTLRSLGAIRQDYSLTKIGYHMAHLPLDVSLARMVLEAAKYGCVQEVVIVAAFLSSRDIFLRPSDRDDWRVRHTHNRRYKEAESDAVMYLRIWKEAQKNNFSPDWCQWRHLSKRSLDEVQSVHRQLLYILRQYDIETSTNDDVKVGLKKALAAGMVRNLLARTSKGDYVGVLQQLRHVVIHPGSTVSKRNPTLIACAEILKTSRTFAKTVIEIEVDWLPEMAPDLFYFLDVQEGADPILKTQVMLRSETGEDLVCGVVESKTIAA